jgi:hypothetical protein
LKGFPEESNTKNVTRPMAQEPKPLPKWILIVSALFALMELMVSLAICFSPESVLETVDLGARGVDYLVYLWGTRQFALGFCIAFATLKRSAPMLTLSYVFLLVMFVGDLLIGISQGEASLVATAAVMCLVSAGMLYAVGRRR